MGVRNSEIVVIAPLGSFTCRGHRLRLQGCKPGEVVVAVADRGRHAHRH